VSRFAEVRVEEHGLLFEAELAIREIALKREGVEPVA
jgi:hypothetical protein